MDMLARVYRLDSFATVRRESSAVCNCMDMLARLYRLDSFATVRRVSSSVCKCMDMLKILHGFIDLIDSSASMDSTKSSPVYNFINKQNYARVIDLLHGAKKMPESINPIKSQ